MALDARHRSSIYEKLVPVLGEEDANVLMSEFPSAEADELVTKQFLRAELAAFRGEVASEFAAFRGEVATQFAGVDTEFAGVTTRFAGVDTEFANVRTEIAQLRTDLTVRMIAIMGTFTGAATALLGILISAD